MGKPEMILAVDLDGTLLRSDMLHESFWSALGRDWQSPFRAARALTNGKAALKRHLAQASEIDVATLPYNADVIAYIKDWRARGGRTALVTASDQAFADAIAAHLDLFDEAHGSDGARNLKGAGKAQFLTDRFGAQGFAYAGDSTADVPVWSQAGLAVTVGASGALQRSAEAASPKTEHLDAPSPALRTYLETLRPHQWLKNALVFLPMLLAHDLSAYTALISLMAFVAFSVVASSVYVLNDLLDLSADRAHPRKRNRPFASGRLPIAHGGALAGGLLALGAVLALLIGPGFFAVMVGYYIMTTAYSLWLKRRMIIDICVLAGLYTIRLIAGGAATGIPLTVWLLAFSIFFFLSLAAVKRQAELVDSAARGELKTKGRGYEVGDLPIISMIAVSAGYVAVLVTVLYVNSPDVVALYHRPQTLWGVGVVLLFWVSRVVLLAHRGEMHDDPVVFAVKDSVSQVCFIAVFSCIVGGMIAPL